MMFNQIRNQAANRAATRRLLIGVAVAVSTWALLCVCCFVNLSTLPSALNVPLCPCDSVQAQGQVPREERQYFSVLSGALRERRTAAVP